jgi:hypothetical protein
MTRLRRALAPIAAVWIACQLAGLAAAPAVVWVSTAEMLVECTCSHGDHAVCPMHHKPAPDSNRCQMRSAQDNQTATLGSLFGGVGVAPVLVNTGALVPAAAVVLADVTTRSLGSNPPDPPPPRS